MLNANVLDFRYVFALANYDANCLRLGMKIVQIFGVSAPFILGALRRNRYSKGSVGN